MDIDKYINRLARQAVELIPEWYILDQWGDPEAKQIFEKVKAHLRNTVKTKKEES